jgi:hypothetical protein
MSILRLTTNLWLIRDYLSPFSWFLPILQSVLMAVGHLKVSLEKPVMGHDFK